MRAAARLTLVALALAAPAGAVAAVEPRADLADVSDEVMCLVCGVPLDQAPDAPQAIREREFIRGLIADGLTKDEIKDRLVAEYGSEVLAEPQTSGFDLAAWLVPGGAIVLAAAGIAVGLRRWRRAAAAVAAVDARRAKTPLDPEEERRLDADMRRYEP